MRKSGTRKPRLRVAGIVRQHFCKIRQRGVELVHALAQGRAQNQNFPGGRIEIPPWAKCGLSIARVARIPGHAAQFQITPREMQCERQIFRISTPRGIELTLH
jgi:hypothetical protein